MANDFLFVFLFVDLAGFFAAWTLTRQYEDIIQLRGIAYCFTLFAILDFSHIVFGSMLSDAMMMMLDLGMGASWLIVRSVVAALCVDALMHKHGNIKHEN